MMYPPPQAGPHGGKGKMEGVNYDEFIPGAIVLATENLANCENDETGSPEETLHSVANSATIRICPLDLPTIPAKRGVPVQ
jgi:hypothetical protein